MLFSKRIYKITGIALIFFLSNTITAFALEDGFGPARKIEGKHFVIYYAPQLDTSNLARHLNIRPSDELLVGKTGGMRFSGDSSLADMVDTLFMQVCDILDMQLYSFEGNLKVCQEPGQLNNIYKNLFDRDLNSHSFYVYDLNTIYISADNFSREILGHEIAHAVISHYFVVLPSVKIQEVLAMYVEYQLRRATQEGVRK